MLGTAARSLHTPAGPGAKGDGMTMAYNHEKVAAIIATQANLPIQREIQNAFGYIFPESGRAWRTQPFTCPARSPMAPPPRNRLEGRLPGGQGDRGPGRDAERAFRRAKMQGRLSGAQQPLLEKAPMNDDPEIKPWQGISVA